MLTKPMLIVKHLNMGKTHFRPQKSTGILFYFSFNGLQKIGLVA